jgi:hypothetical protein
MVNFPSGYALHLTTQEMVTEVSYIGKISTDKKYSMSISNSVIVGTKLADRSLILAL